MAVAGGFKTTSVAFISALMTMIVVDGLWLGTMIKRFYRPRLATLMAESPSLPPAVVFYLLYALCLSILVVVPAVRTQTGTMQILLTGSLLGLMAYGTYDLTNQATLRDWPLSLTLVDLAWGCVLTGLVSAASAYFTRLWG